MKKLLIYIFLAQGMMAFGQQKTDGIRQQLDHAKLMATLGRNMGDEAKKAFASYSKLAEAGNAEAMNGLGQLYSRGVGTSADERQALKWFKKAAANNYAPACFNVALFYKNGLTVMQDFSRAYAYFEKGAALGNEDCIYGQGYMLHKGYGCAQSYEQAVKLFKRGAALGNRGSCYMLGLCYRNGYGLVKNIDSARSYLIKASKMGDTRASHELQNPSPENADIKDVPQLQAPASTGAKPVDLKKGFAQITHGVHRGEELSGTYEGYSLKFDWSGKHIIGKDRLKLSLQCNKGTVQGSWEEEGQQAVTIAGILTDTALVFESSSMNRKSHYHPGGTEFIFKDARLNLTKSSDSLYLSGTLRMYWPQQKEPQRPEFIMLVRKAAKDSTAILKSQEYLNAQADSLNFKAYPNPFSDRLTLSYTLQKPARVSITISEVATGMVVYRGSPGNLQAGEHSTPVAFNGRIGNYLVVLRYGNQIKSAVVLKR